MSRRQASIISDFRNEIIKYQFYNSRSLAKGPLTHIKNMKGSEQSKGFSVSWAESCLSVRSSPPSKQELGKATFFTSSLVKMDSPGITQRALSTFFVFWEHRGLVTNTHWVSKTVSQWGRDSCLGICLIVLKFVGKKKRYEYFSWTTGESHVKAG